MIHVLKRNQLRYLKTLPILCLGVLLLGRTSGGLYAQETRTIAITEAIRMALKNNIGLRQASNQVVAGEVAVKQSKADFLPNLSAGFSASRNYPRRSGGSESMSGSISSSLNLFDGWNNVARLNSAKLGWASDTADYSWNRQSIIFETVSQFMQTVLDSEFIRIEMDNLEAQQQQLKQIEEFQKAGNRSKVDVYQQLADLKQSELQLLQAQRDYEVNRLNLLRTLGQPVESNIQLRSLAVQNLIARIVHQSPQVTAKEALDHRDDALATQFQILQSQQQVRAARSGYWPSLSLSTGLSSNYSSTTPGLGLSDQLFNENPNMRVGLSLSIPLFDRLTTKYNTEQAQIQLSNQRLNLQDLELQIGSQVQQALLDYQTAVKKSEAAHAQYEYAGEAQKISEERYRVGATTYIELSLTRANHSDAAYQMVSADYNLVLQYIALHYYGGDIDSGLAIFNDSGERP